MHGLKIISGGQTGVDRAALDAAMSRGLAVGGWCPRDRWAEDGAIPERYPLFETRSKDAHQRTQRNVECSSATLVITRGPLMGGTRLTIEIAEALRRPLLIIDLADFRDDPVERIVSWVQQVAPSVLNVAGPKESGAPGIQAETAAILGAVLDRLPSLGLVYETNDA